MTDESYGVGQTDEPSPAATPTEDGDRASVLEGAGDFTSGEGLVAFAGMVTVATWIIFSILVTEYFVFFLPLALATAAAVLPRINRASVERFAPLNVIMKALGYALAVVALYALVEDLRFEHLDEVGAIIGGLVYYAAGVMAFIGARQIKI